MTNNAAPVTPSAQAPEDRVYLAGTSGRVVHIDPGETGNMCAGQTLGAEFARRPKGKVFSGLNGERYRPLSSDDVAEVRSWGSSGAACDCEHSAAFRAQR